MLWSSFKKFYFYLFWSNNKPTVKDWQLGGWWNLFCVDTRAIWTIIIYTSHYLWQLVNWNCVRIRSSWTIMFIVSFSLLVPSSHGEVLRICDHSWSVTDVHLSIIPLTTLFCVLLLWNYWWHSHETSHMYRSWSLVWIICVQRRKL